MQFDQDRLQSLEGIRCGLDHEQHFGGAFHFAFPAVHRFHLGNDVDAGGQLPLDQRAGNVPSLFEELQVVRTSLGSSYLRSVRSWVSHIESGVALDLATVLLPSDFTPKARRMKA